VNFRAEGDIADLKGLKIYVFKLYFFRAIWRNILI